MIIKTDEERVFVNLDVVDAVWSDAPRRDHYNVGIGAHALFEVSRQVGDAILDAVLKQWSADTGGQASGDALWREARALLKVKELPADPPEDNHQRLSLANLGDGGALELFDVALQEVLKNIQDPNTPADAARSITLTVTFKPDKSRDIGRCKYKVVPKLAPIAEQETMIFLAQSPGESGDYYATEHNPKQPNLAFHETEVGNAR